MFDDLADLSLDPDILAALAELDLGEGVVSAHDVDAINQVLGGSMEGIPPDLSHLSPDALAVLEEALGGDLGTPLGDGASTDTAFIDPFGVGDTTDGVLSAAQTAFAEAGTQTDVGFAFLPDEDQYAAAHVPDYPGEYVLDVHGGPESVSLPGVADLSAADFAEVVENETNWNDQPIRLFSCNTGADAGGFAQQLADELGTTVIAPTEVVWSFPDAPPVVGDPVFDPLTGLFVPPEPASGTWATFVPGAA